MGSVVAVRQTWMIGQRVGLSHQSAPAVQLSSCRVSVGQSRWKLCPFCPLGRSSVRLSRPSRHSRQNFSTRPVMAPVSPAWAECTSRFAFSDG